MSERDTENKQGIMDEKELLREELKQRLKWYQERQTEEEIDEQEIEMILNLLEIMDPLPETEDEKETERAEKAYARFEQNYLPKERKRGVLRRNKVLRCAVLTAAAVLILFAVLNIGTYASAGVDFFTFLWQDGGGRSFVAVGEDVEGMAVEDEGMSYDSNDVAEFSSWDDLSEEVRGQILIPTEVPEDMKLTRLRILGGKYMSTANAVYENEDGKRKIQIWIEKFSVRPTWQQVVNADATFIEDISVDGRDCKVYTYEDEIIIYFYDEGALYTLFGSCSAEEIESVISGME